MINWLGSTLGSALDLNLVTSVVSDTLTNNKSSSNSNTALLAQSTSDAVSDEFAAFITKIGKTRCRESENETVLSMKEALKEKLEDPLLINNRLEMKDVLLRLIYCEMLGHSIDQFGSIHLVNFIALNDLTLYEKRLSYLAAGLILHRKHEMILLIINSIQKDLRSKRYMIVLSALIAASKLLNYETIPAVLPFVIPLLKHQRSEVRKKAISTLHAFYNIEKEESDDVESYNGTYLQYIDTMLNDFDPMVLSATICFLSDYVADCHVRLIKEKKNSSSTESQGQKTIDPKVLKLTSYVVSIFNQIIEYNIEQDYMYSKLPAPWFQIKILQVFTLLGRQNKSTSQELYELIRTAYKKAERAENATGIAIMFQCVKTAINIYPSQHMLQFIYDSVTRFIWNNDMKVPNIRYTALEMLRMVLRYNTELVALHQEMIIDSLSSNDETIQKLTSRLLTRMANQSNTKTILDRLIKYLAYVISVNDIFMAEELVANIRNIFDRFTDDYYWYVEIVVDFLKAVGDEKNTKNQPLIEDQVVNIIVKNILDETKLDEELGPFIIERYYKLLYDQVYTDSKLFPNCLFTVIVYVLRGLSSYVDDHKENEEEPSKENIIELFLSLINSSLYFDSRLKSCIISSSMEVYLKIKSPDDLGERITSALLPLKNSRHEDVFERTYQLMSLCEFDNPKSLNDLDELIYSEENTKVDSSLSFLQSYVESLKEEGLPVYSQELKEEVMEKQKLLTHKRHSKKKDLIIVIDKVEPVEINFKGDDLDTRIRNSKKVWSQEDCLEETPNRVEEESETIKAMKAKIKKKRLQKEMEEKQKEEEEKKNLTEEEKTGEEESMSDGNNSETTKEDEKEEVKTTEPEKVAKEKTIEKVQTPQTPQFIPIPFPYPSYDPAQMASFYQYPQAFQMPYGQQIPGQPLQYVYVPPTNSQLMQMMQMPHQPFPFMPVNQINQGSGSPQFGYPVSQQVPGHVFQPIRPATPNNPTIQPVFPNQVVQQTHPIQQTEAITEVPKAVEEVKESIEDVEQQVQKEEEEQDVSPTTESNEENQDSELIINMTC
ncbi:predicted protein [Naegleria gruberi]|uniref:Predicted protein n=1 Tax=Naegleria gruberi TaxID=5762 RepID=D2V9H1_NAEGR|nr:uncharacterized protein NAEGRDRAFT_65439 [Naegleria gruberi]EFC46457.1 predicted protein [Naegleria gruberi]|eukprot:XP_002679201.1 predicted protein [Naegleria gruberi strain NEG-M]